MVVMMLYCRTLTQGEGELQRNGSSGVGSVLCCVVVQGNDRG